MSRSLILRPIKIYIFCLTNNYDMYETYNIPKSYWGRKDSYFLGIIGILSLFLSVYLEKYNIIVIYLISLLTFFMAGRYEEVKYLGNAFSMLFLVSLVMLIPNLKEAIIIEILYLPFYIAHLKEIEIFPKGEIIKHYLLNRALYYLLIISMINLSFMITGYGKGIINYISVFIVLSLANYFILKDIKVYFLLSLNEKRLVIYAILYSIIIILITITLFTII